MALYDPEIARLVSRIEQLRSVRSVVFWASGGDSVPRGDHHLHAIPTVFACIDGAARVEGGPRGRIDLQAGEVLVIAPGVRHQVSPLRHGSTAIGLGFLAGVCDFELSDAERNLWCRVPLEPYRSLCYRLVRAEPEQRLALCRRLFAALAGECVEHMGFPHPAQRAMAYRLWSNAPQLDAAAILAASGLKPRRAHALFQGFFHATPKQALLAQRLDLAAWYLDQGLGIGEAGARAGFHRRADFTRAWRNRHGTPPSARGTMKKR